MKITQQNESGSIECAYNSGADTENFNLTVPTGRYGAIVMKVNLCLLDEAEARKRAQEIRNYASLGITIQPSSRVYKRPVSEKLDEGFTKLYEKEMNDVQISTELNVSQTSVRDYRRNLELPAHKKIPSCANRTADKKIFNQTQYSK